MTPFFVSTTVDVFTSPLPVPSTTSRICTAAYAGSQDQKLKLQPFVGWTCLWFAVCGNLQTLAACRQTLLGWSSWVRSSWRAKMTCINLDRLLCQILPRSLHVHRCLAVAAQGAKHKSGTCVLEYPCRKPLVFTHLQEGQRADLFFGHCSSEKHVYFVHVDPRHVLVGNSNCR